MKTKLCLKCDTEKSIDQFGKNKSRKDGLQFYCKECSKTYFSNYYRQHPDEHKARVRHYQNTHPIKLKTCFLCHKQVQKWIEKHSIILCLKCQDQSSKAIILEHEKRYTRQLEIINAINETRKLNQISQEQRFWNKVSIKNTDDCWIWTGGVRGRTGYGSMKWNEKVTDVHRISYELNIGSIPDGLIICHKCDIKLCVNPTHLYAGSYKDNMLDRLQPNRHGIFKPSS